MNDLSPSDEITFPVPLDVATVDKLKFSAACQKPPLNILQEIARRLKESFERDRREGGE